MSSPVLDCLAFRVGERPFLLPASAVVEVLPMLELAPLPGAAPPVLGTLNRRGSPIPVLDGGARLGHTALSSSIDSYILVIESGGRTVGLVVSDVDGVVAVDTTGTSAGPYVTPRGLAPLLDPGQLLAP